MSPIRFNLRHNTSSGCSHRSNWVTLVAVLLLLSLFFFQCSRPESEQIVILVSIDGFRWDYFDKAPTPALDRLIDLGVKAESLIPIFPTKTFPNHYSLVTGLYADHHGIVSNNMFDQALDASFSMGNRKAVQDGRWWGGEPIWVAAERRGIKTAPLFWPGSEAEIEGVRPAYWKPYDGDFTSKERISQAISWLKLPENERPMFITLYFSDTDGAGHRFGPDSPQVVEAITRVDSAVAILVDSLNSNQLTNKLNLIITSDHGMTDISPDRVVFLDDYIDLSQVRVVDWSPIAAIQPEPEKVDEIFEKLSNAHPHLKLYRKGDLPDRLHFDNHPRIPEIIAIADDGWSITSRDYFKDRKNLYVGGSHGYDNQYESMHGIFVAQGPAFRKGVRVDPIEMVDVYNLMTHILKIEAAPNDGDWSAVKDMLK